MKNELDELFLIKVVVRVHYIFLERCQVMPKRRKKVDLSVMISVFPKHKKEIS